MSRKVQHEALNVHDGDESCHEEVARSIKSVSFKIIFVFVEIPIKAIILNLVDFLHVAPFPLPTDTHIPLSCSVSFSMSVVAMPMH